MYFVLELILHDDSPGQSKLKAGQNVWAPYIFSGNSSLSLLLSSTKSIQCGKNV